MKTCFLLVNIIDCICAVTQDGIISSNCFPKQFMGASIHLQNYHGGVCQVPKGDLRLRVVRMTSDFEKTNPYVEELKRTAARIAQPGKGILASDESNATTGKR